jgi:hypothetical protein
LWSARLFRHAALSAPIDVPRGFPVEAVGLDAFAPLGARVRPGARDLVPTYPAGLPLHIAAANLFLSEESAVKAVMIVTVAATLFLLYTLAREAGLERWWALAGCAVLACSPLFLFMAVQPMSDVAATMWAEAAVICAWRARRRRVSAALAGASLGMATLVRPTNVLLLLPIVAAMPLTLPNVSRLVVGGLPFVAFLTAYQTFAYGNPLSSGYGGLSPMFSSVNVGASIRNYATWLPHLASWLIVLVPAAAWGWRDAFERWRLIAGTWMLVLFGVYAFYPVTSETWWSLRFVLPAFPPLITASLVGLRQIARAADRFVPTACPEPRRRGAHALVSAAVIALCLAALVRGPQFTFFRDVSDGERVYPDALKVMALERPSYTAALMVQMSGAANYYAPQLHIIRYDWLTPDGWQAIRTWQSREHVVIGAALFGSETEEFFRRDRTPLTCSWQPRGHYRHVTFWECPP